MDNFGCKFQKLLTLIGLKNIGLYYLRSKKSIDRAIFRSDESGLHLCFGSIGSVLLYVLDLTSSWFSSESQEGHISSRCDKNNKGLFFILFLESGDTFSRSSYSTSPLVTSTRIVSLCHTCTMLDSNHLRVTPWGWGQPACSTQQGKGRVV